MRESRIITPWASQTRSTSHSKSHLRRHIVTENSTNYSNQLSTYLAISWWRCPGLIMKLTQNERSNLTSRRRHPWNNESWIREILAQHTGRDIEQDALNVETSLCQLESRFALRNVNDSIEAQIQEIVSRTMNTSYTSYEASTDLRVSARTRLWARTSKR